MVGRLVKISPYRTGEPRFGTREHKPFDNSVKTYKLSPEELAKYRGENVKEKEKKGANKMAVAEKEVKRPGRPRGSVIKVARYVELSEKGLLDKEIAQEIGVSSSTLANWKQKNKSEIEVEKAKRIVKSDTVEKSKYEKLQKEYDELKQRLEEKLKEKNVDYKKLYNELSKDYEKLVHEAEEAEEKVEELKVEIRILKEREKLLEQDVVNVDYQRQEYEEAYKKFCEELNTLRKLALVYVENAMKEGRRYEL